MNANCVCLAPAQNKLNKRTVLAHTHTCRLCCGRRFARKRRQRNRRPLTANQRRQQALRNNYSRLSQLGARRRRRCRHVTRPQPQPQTERKGEAANRAASRKGATQSITVLLVCETSGSFPANNCSKRRRKTNTRRQIAPNETTRRRRANHFCPPQQLVANHSDGKSRSNSTDHPNRVLRNRRT